MGSFNEVDYKSQLDFNKKVLSRISGVNNICDLLTLIIFLGQYIMFSYAKCVGEERVEWKTGAKTVYDESNLLVLRTLAKLRNSVCHMSDRQELRKLINKLIIERDEVYLIDDTFIQEKATILLNSEFIHLLKLLDEDKRDSSPLNLALDNLMCL